MARASRSRWAEKAATDGSLLGLLEDDASCDMVDDDGDDDDDDGWSANFTRRLEDMVLARDKADRAGADDNSLFEVAEGVAAMVARRGAVGCIVKSSGDEAIQH